MDWFTILFLVEADREIGIGVLILVEPNEMFVVRNIVLTHKMLLKMVKECLLKGKAEVCLIPKKKSARSCESAAGSAPTGRGIISATLSAKRASPYEKRPVLKV